MAANDSRLPPACDCDALPLLAADDSQLQFAFTCQETPVGDAPVSSAPVRPGFAARRPPRAPERPPGERELERGLAGHLPPGKSLELRLTENRYTIISVERGRQRYRVRVHRMFASVEPRLVRALARYVVHNDQRASRLLSEYIERHQNQIRRPPRRARRVVLRTRGRVHDLKATYDRLNRRYFAGKLDLRITWGAARRRPAQRSIKAGAFLVEDRLIRVHPVLDQEMVPAYFLDWIVFHEMLHGKHAIRRVKGRRCFHPPELVREEKQFPHYWRARVWEKANLDRLLG
jgi:hypothetical protein